MDMKYPLNCEIRREGCKVEKDGSLFVFENITKDDRHGNSSFWRLFQADQIIFSYATQFFTYYFGISSWIFYILLILCQTITSGDICSDSRWMNYLYTPHFNPLKKQMSPNDLTKAHILNNAFLIQKHIQTIRKNIHRHEAPVSYNSSHSQRLMIFIIFIMGMI